MKAVDILINNGVCISKAEARRLLNSGKVSLNGEILREEDDFRASPKDGDKLKVGSKEIPLKE